MSAPVLSTALNLDSDEAKQRIAHNRALAEELRAKVAEAALGGSQKSRERHVARGKLLPRERVERLLDPGSPLLEIGQLAANGMYEGDVHIVNFGDSMYQAQARPMCPAVEPAATRLSAVACSVVLESVSGTMVLLAQFAAG